MKRDKYAGLTRKQRRKRQRDEMFAKAEEEEGFKLPNQKAAAKSAKSEARRNPTPVGMKRKALEPPGGGGEKKPPKAPRQDKPPREDAAPARKGPNKKMRSHSKAKFAKARKR